MHIKSPRSGMSLRQANGDEVWISPGRDVVHCFLTLFGKASIFARGYANSNRVLAELLAGMDAQEIERAVENFATAMAKFAKIAADDPKGRISVSQAAADAELYAGDPRVMGAVGWAFLNIMASQYWAGVRVMAAQKHDPFALNEPDLMLDMLRAELNPENGGADERRP